MKRLLVYCYFCPDAPHRPGGVQQIVGPLLAALSESADWAITVVHTGPCHAARAHLAFQEYIEVSQPEAVNPNILLQGVRQMRTLASEHDVVLSIDRILPSPLGKPSVLMSNTLGYQTEAVAAQAAQWARIIAPTRTFANCVRAVNGREQVDVVPYGLSKDTLREAASAPPATPNAEIAIVRLPHRPDPRKGHREAIEGLAHAVPAWPNVRLDISWLGEARYASYRHDLEQLADRLGIADRVSFLDWVDGNQRLKATVDSCAVLQLGRFEESFGLAIVESILFGRPAVVGHQPAVAEIVGATGMLVELCDPLEWGDALRAHYSGRGRSRAEIEYKRYLGSTLTIDRMTQHYDRILTEAIEA